MSKLTIDNVLRLLDEEYLFSYYFPLPIKKRKNIYISPFRHDSKSGSCHFNWYKGRFLFFDKSNNKCHDVFDYLSFVHKISLYESLYKVCVDFDLDLEVDYSRINVESFVDNIPHHNQEYLHKAKERVNRVEDTGAVYKVKTRKMSEEDLKFWSSYYIDKKLLHKNYVKSIQQSYIHTGISWKPIFKRSDDTLYFLYIILPVYGEDVSMKLYRPYSDNFKWSASFREENICHGYHSLDRRYDTLLISSSLKDSMVLQSLGYEACSPSSESSTIDHRIISELKLKYKNVYILFDYDKPGVNNSIKFKQLYDVDNIILNGLKTKDISDEIKRTSYQHVKNLIEYELKSKSNFQYGKQKLEGCIQ